MIGTYQKGDATSEMTQDMIQVVSSFGFGNEPSVFIKGGTFLD
jgi:hypothetical protein